MKTLNVLVSRHNALIIFQTWHELLQYIDICIIHKTKKKDKGQTMIGHLPTYSGVPKQERTREGVALTIKVNEDQIKVC